MHVHSVAGCALTSRPPIPQVCAAAPAPAAGAAHRAAHIAAGRGRGQRRAHAAAPLHPRIHPGADWPRGLRHQGAPGRVLPPSRGQSMLRSCNMAATVLAGCWWRISDRPIRCDRPGGMPRRCAAWRLLAPIAAAVIYHLSNAGAAAVRAPGPQRSERPPVGHVPAVLPLGARDAAGCHGVLCNG